MTIAEIHRLLANSIWMFYLALALWGLFRSIRREPVDGSYLGALVVIQVLVLVQGLLGGLLLAGGSRPGRPELHILYGIFSVVFIPGLFTYLRGDDSNRAMWVYSLATLFMVGVSLRLTSAV